jgi:hypothetical protein
LIDAELALDKRANPSHIDINLLLKLHFVLNEPGSWNIYHPDSPVNFVLEQNVIVNLKELQAEK